MSQDNDMDVTMAWAKRVVDSTLPLADALRPQTVVLQPQAAQDVRALLEATRTLSERVADPSGDARHDMMNLIGAIRGYAEMLQEEGAEIHTAVAAALPVLLRASMTPNNHGIDDTPSDYQGVKQNAGEHGHRQNIVEPGVILAVDDMPENRDLVSRLLGKSGHTVLTAESGEEALELLNTMAVDVVLLDLMMPGIGGAEVLKQLKDNERLRATPVVMISGRQDMDQIIACIQAGADDYLLKPFNPVLLQARIAAGIERKRWHDREEQYREQLERRERFIRRTFGRYLSDDIVDEILESPEGLELGGDLREVTIMMSDIRGFTTFSEHLPPQQVVTLLNRYLGRMTDIILSYQGTIDEFLGDAVLAVFGAPRRRDNDAERAVRCAIEMQQAMDAINAANLADGLPTLEMAIALNTGTVVAGNIGSERRSKYGFVGHAMNVTSRIEDITAPNEILAAQSTIDAIQARCQVGDRRTVSVRGIDETIAVYSIKGIES